MNGKYLCLGSLGRSLRQPCKLRAVQYLLRCMRRVRCLILIIPVVFACSHRTVARATESVEVTLDYVAKRAEEKARKPFRSPRGDLPDVLRADKLHYDKYREIRF